MGHFHGCVHDFMDVTMGDVPMGGVGLGAGCGGTVTCDCESPPPLDVMSEAAEEAR